mmetsp:Transcript_121/g.298  ORF Transcript_121/g.298 Transcript_121/m.298 type:complete len:127 (+) Transcript_121:2657-3037(+)
MLETRKHHLSPRCRTYGMVLEEFLPSLKRNFSCPTAERAASFILRSPSPFSQRTLHRNFDQMRPSNNNRHTRLQQRQNDLPLACCHNHSQWLHPSEAHTKGTSEAQGWVWIVREDSTQIKKQRTFL